MVLLERHPETGASSEDTMILRARIVHVLKNMPLEQETLEQATAIINGEPGYVALHYHVVQHFDNNGLISVKSSKKWANRDWHAGFRLHPKHLGPPREELAYELDFTLRTPEGTTGPIDHRLTLVATERDGMHDLTEWNLRREPVTQHPDTT